MQASSLKKSKYFIFSNKNPPAMLSFAGLAADLFLQQSALMNLKDLTQKERRDLFIDATNHLKQQGVFHKEISRELQKVTPG